MLKKKQNWTVVNAVKTDCIKKSYCSRGKRLQYRTVFNSEYKGKGVYSQGAEWRGGWVT